jgi:uncharacterized protein (TIGR02118 family)
MEMIKRMVFLRRRPDLSFAEFEAHWVSRHADIARELPNLRGLRLNLVESWLPAETAWDGIGEVWFEDMTQVKAAYEAEPLARALAEDRAQFATMESQVCFVREVTIVAPPGSARG